MRVQDIRSNAKPKHNDSPENDEELRQHHMTTNIPSHKLALEQGFERTWKTSKLPIMMITSLAVQRGDPLTDSEFGELVFKLSERVRQRYRLPADLLLGLNLEEIVSRIAKLAKQSKLHRQHATISSYLNLSEAIHQADIFGVSGLPAHFYQLNPSLIPGELDAGFEQITQLPASMFWHKQVQTRRDIESEAVSDILRTVVTSVPDPEPVNLVGHGREDLLRYLVPLERLERLELYALEHSLLKAVAAGQEIDGREWDRFQLLSARHFHTGGMSSAPVSDWTEKSFGATEEAELDSLLNAWIVSQTSREPLPEADWRRLMRLATIHAAHDPEQAKKLSENRGIQVQGSETGWTVIA